MFALLISTALAAEPAMCHLEPLDSNGWHYRTRISPLPDRLCWYLGPRMKPRSELYWPEAPSVPPIEITTPEPEREFDLRWKGEAR